MYIEVKRLIEGVIYMDDKNKFDEEGRDREEDLLRDEERNIYDEDPSPELERTEYDLEEENFSEEEIHREEYLTQREYREDQKKRRFRGSALSYIALALVAALIGGLASPYLGAKLYGELLPYPESNQYITEQVVINPQEEYTTVSAVVNKSMSSVVGITTIEEIQQFWFLPQEVEGVGTGVIVDSNGYILTNSHVVRDGNAKSIHVLFENGEKQEAKLLWNEPELDLAIVKVDKTGLQAADLGDSDDLSVGELAVAIGNPLGLEFQRSVTSGIISGLNRSIQISQNSVIDNLIQTDASINNGNSGGPLLNNKGEIIGINTAKIKTAEGLGFAIPINEAKLIIEEVIEKGNFESVYLGISGVTVDKYEETLGVEIEAEKGIILVQIYKDTPAHKAGLINGDVLVKLDDTELDDMLKLKKALYRYKKGDKAKLTIIRNGEEKEIEVDFFDVNR